MRTPEIKPGIRRLLRLALPRSTPDDADDEIRLHLQLRTDQLIREGLSPEAARAEAERRFGPIDQERVRFHDAAQRRERRIRFREVADDFRSDLRSAARALRRAPGFVSVAVASLAIGIAANTTVFTVIEGVVLRPLPYHRDHELLAMNTRFHPESGYDIPQMGASWPELADYAARSRELVSVGSFAPASVTFGAGNGAPERIAAANVSWNLFDVLGVRPALGRGFVQEDDDPAAACTLIIGDRLWRNRFGADSSVLERSIDLEGQSCRVTGVMPPDFMFPTASVQVWQTLAGVPTDLRNARESHVLFGVARLTPGASLETARVEAALIGREWEASHPDHHRGHGVTLRTLKDAFIGGDQETLTVLWIAVGLVLVIVCVNLANLELNRVEARRLELAVRSALGAGRGRLTRQLLVENLVIVGLGWGLGVLLTVWGVRGFLLAYPTDLPRGEAVTLNPTVLAFSAIIAAASVLAIGLVPALRFSRGTGASALRADVRGTGGASTRRFRSVLVTVQVALAVGIVVPALLLVRSYRALTQIDLGVVASRTLTASVTLPSDPYGDATRAPGFYEAVIARLGAPDIEAAGAMSFLPIQAVRGGDAFQVEGRPAPAPGEEQTVGGYYLVTPGVFRALGIPMRAGRGLEPSDQAGSLPVAVVNEAAARRYWPGESPVGRRIRFFAADSGWITIVGVVGDVRGANVTEPPPPAVYTSVAQNLRPRYSARAMAWVLRARSDLGSARSLLVQAVGEVDPRVPVADIRPLVELTRENVGDTRFAAQILGGFAIAATLLGLIGVYGVVSYVVRLRTREIAVRMALGATSDRVVRGVLATGLGPVLAGAVLGATGAILVSRAVKSLLFGIGVVDIMTYGAVVLALVLTGIVACLFPALRAARIDPQAALREG